MVTHRLPLSGGVLPDPPTPHHSVMALWCYACHEPTSVSSCITITEYNANETLCKTILYTLEICQ